MEFQLLLNVVGVILIDVEDNELFGGIFRDLAAQLAADAPSPAGDEDGPAAQQRLDRCGVERDLVAAEQVLDLHLAQLGDARGLTDHLKGAGKRHDVDAALAQTSQHRAALAVRHGGDREDGVGQADGGHLLHRLLERAAHGNAVEHFAALAPVVVKEALGPVAAGGIAAQLLRKLGARLPCAEDRHGDQRAVVAPQDARAVAAVEKAYRQHAEHPRTGDAEEQNEGHGSHRRNAGDDLVGGKAAQRRGEQAQILLTFGVAPKTVVGLEHELEEHRAEVEQGDMSADVTRRADLCIVEVGIDEQEERDGRREDQRVAEKENFFSETTHGF